MGVARSKRKAGEGDVKPRYRGNVEYCGGDVDGARGESKGGAKSDG